MKKYVHFIVATLFGICFSFTASAALNDEASFTNDHSNLFSTSGSDITESTTPLIIAGGRGGGGGFGCTTGTMTSVDPAWLIFLLISGIGYLRRQKVRLAERKMKKAA